MEKPKSKLGTKIEHLTRVNHPDPDVARRGQLLNIILLSVLTAASFGLALGLIVCLLDDWTRQGEILLVIVCAVSIVFLGGLYFVNRAGSSRFAPIVFLLGFMILISWSDEPQYLIAGRATLIYCLPIVMASVLLKPWSSFVVAALAGIALFALALANNLELASLFVAIVTEITIFLLVALVSWLSARSLEQALADLRVANAELDRRVADRTQHLSEALIRVQLEASKNQAILESIADGVMVFDGQGCAVAVNPAVSRLLKIPAEELIGYPISQLLSGVISTAAPVDTSQSGVQDSVTRLPTMRLKWGNKILSTSLAPIRIEQESGRGMVAVFRDITREAELERMKSSFVSLVSHELRTPLGAIIGYGEILQEQIYGPLTERQMNLVTRLVANAQRLVKLVSDLLDRAQLEAGKLTLRLVAFPPQQLLDEMLLTLGPAAQDKQLELVTRVTPVVPDTLIGDPQRLQQILTNLLSNALKFTEHGSISVKIDRPDDTHWTLQVSDTGSGIPLDDQPQIFEAFQQADSSVTRRHGGAGLGLSIVKQLATLMGGEVSLSSVVGEGSTFTVTLPLKPGLEDQRD